MGAGWGVRRGGIADLPVVAEEGAPPVGIEREGKLLSAAAPPVTTLPLRPPQKRARRPASPPAKTRRARGRVLRMKYPKGPSAGGKREGLGRSSISGLW